MPQCQSECIHRKHQISTQCAVVPPRQESVPPLVYGASINSPVQPAYIRDPPLPPAPPDRPALRTLFKLFVTARPRPENQHQHIDHSQLTPPSP